MKRIITTAVLCVVLASPVMAKPDFAHISKYVQLLTHKQWQLVGKLSSGQWLEVKRLNDNQLDVVNKLDDHWQVLSFSTMSDAQYSKPEEKSRALGKLTDDQLAAVIGLSHYGWIGLRNLTEVQVEVIKELDDSQLSALKELTHDELIEFRKISDEALVGIKKLNDFEYQVERLVALTEKVILLNPVEFRGMVDILAESDQKAALQFVKRARRHIEAGGELSDEEMMADLKSAYKKGMGFVSFLSNIFGKERLIQIGEKGITKLEQEIETALSNY